MTVHINTPSKSIAAAEVVNATEAAVRQLVQSVIATRIDENINSLICAQDEIVGEVTRSMIVDYIEGIREAARGDIASMLAELGERMMDVLDQAAIRAVVTQIQYDPADGFVTDATVAVDVNY